MKTGKSKRPKSNQDKARPYPSPSSLGTSNTASRPVIQETDGPSNRSSMTEARQIRATVISLLEKRDAGKTICPSEVSRAVFGTPGGNKKEFMDRTRAIVAEMADEGLLEVCQKGKVVDIKTAKGPIRLRQRMEG